MEIKQTKGQLYLYDKIGNEIRLDPDDVADLVGYLKIHLRGRYGE